MKRNLLVIVAVLFVSMGWSQTVTINLKNGNTVEYNMGDIESLVFIEGNDDEDTSIVGVWECISYEHSEGVFENPTLKVGDFLYINDDSTYSMREKDTNNVLDEGKWSLNDKELTIDSDFPNIMTTTFSILKLDSSTLSFTWYGFVTLSFRRITNQQS